MLYNMVMMLKLLKNNENKKIITAIKASKATSASQSYFCARAGNEWIEIVCNVMRVQLLKALVQFNSFAGGGSKTLASSCG